MTSRSRHAIESCMSQLQEWKPFQIDPHPPMPIPMSYPFYPKKHSVSDPSTDRGAEVAAMDLSKLTLADGPSSSRQKGHGGFQYLDRKRRRHGKGSRSVSGRSSDRSGRRTKRCCSVGGGGPSGAYATCSDFPVLAGGTDSSGEMFMNGDGNWGSDASEARISRKEMKDLGGGGGGGGSVMEKDGMGFMLFQSCTGVVSDLLGNDSGYGSETGYKGDAEFGYEDEFDEEEDDGGRLSFWDDRVGDHNRMDLGSSTSFRDLKYHHTRCRRKKDIGDYLSIRKIKRA